MTEDLEDRLYLVGITKFLDGGNPAIFGEVVGVLEGDLLGIDIDIDALNFSEVAADILDECGASIAVDAGNGDNSFHRKDV